MNSSTGAGEMNDTCPKCGTSLQCRGGRSAHWSNWYCPVCPEKETAVTQHSGMVSGWRTIDKPPTEEDGYVLIWAENMPVSVGCWDEDYYIFTECSDLHNYFEGDVNWLKEHWTHWMPLPDPKSQQHSGMVSVPEDTLIAACAYLTQAAEDIEAWGSYASDYFQKKYGLKDDIRLYKQRASEFEAMAAAQEQQHEM